MKGFVFLSILFLVSCGGGASNESDDSGSESQFSLSLTDIQGVWISDCMAIDNATSQDLSAVLEHSGFLGDYWIVETIRLGSDSIGFDYSIHYTQDCVDDAGHEIGLDVLMPLINGDRTILDTSKFRSSDNFDSIHIDFGVSDNSEGVDLTLVDGVLRKINRAGDSSTTVDFNIGYSRT